MNHTVLGLIGISVSEFMGKTFQAAQLTHERFLTIDYSCKILFWYLPNWTSSDLSVYYYMLRIVLHTRGPWKFSLADTYQKYILLEWSMVKNLSCVSCAAWNVFPINLLLTVTPNIQSLQCYGWYWYFTMLFSTIFRWIAKQWSSKQRESLQIIFHSDWLS